MNKTSEYRLLIVAVLVMGAALGGLQTWLVNEQVSDVENRTTCIAGILFQPPPPDDSRFDHFTEDRLKDECGFTESEIEEILP